ncbi:MAG: hypothetical protein WDA75_16110 [Candidatus Latescibacterota bacterium]
MKTATAQTRIASLDAIRIALALLSFNVLFAAAFAVQLVEAARIIG